MTQPIEKSLADIAANFHDIAAEFDEQRHELRNRDQGLAVVLQRMEASQGRIERMMLDVLKKQTEFERDLEVHKRSTSEQLSELRKRITNGKFVTAGT